MPDPPATQVVTGAADDGRHRLRQLDVGALGWLLWAGLVVWLASRASPDALDVATFLATAVLTTALVVVVTALVLLRPSIMRRRQHAPAVEVATALPAASAQRLTGEIELQAEGGVRSYAPVEEARG
jgi:hypothetical protein